MTHIDRKLQDRLEGWNNNATIELFEGEPYIEGYTVDDDWSTLFTRSGSLIVAKYEDGKFTPKCTIQFTPSGKSVNTRAIGQSEIRVAT